MCLASLALSTAGLWYYLRLAALLIFCAEGLIIGVTYASYRLRLKNIDTPEYHTPWPLPNRLFIPWRYLILFAQMVRASKWVNQHMFSLAVLFGIAIGIPLGRLSAELPRYNQVREEQWHVLKQDAPFQYTVMVNGKRVFYLICQDADDPMFEEGETDNVTLKDMGTCVSLSPGIGMGFTTVRDEHGQIIHTGGE
jgi:hypothetical protein